MMEGAFYQQKRNSPTALAIVVLMHGAAVTALAMAKMDVITKDKLPPIVVDFLEEKKTPPEVPPEPVEKAVKPPETVITHVPPIIRTPPQPMIIPLQPLPPAPRIVLDPPREIVPPRADPPAPPAARKVAPARARANLASYVSDEDYPSSAIRNEEQGTTRFRLAVGPDGRVADCTVTASSGSSALDSATCRLMRQRARFTPARDSDGRATSDSVASAIRWVLAE